jgi:diadenosine tetraphosphatase ApaH/serine/threonine PP2A family protein phosphatase
MRSDDRRISSREEKKSDFSMRIGILSDVHSNLEALTAVLEDAKKQNIDDYVCVGDIVGYCANPNECIDIIRDLSRNSIAGNHDFGVCSLTDITFFNDFAKRAIEWTKKVIKVDHLSFLKSLPLSCEIEDLLFVHSSPSSPDTWNYVLSMYDAKREFDFFSNQICFIGHSHQPVTFSVNSKNELGSSIENMIEISKNKRYIINAGSVGQPRDGNPKASYCIYDSKEGTVSFKRIPYDIESTQEKIIKAGLPLFLAKRLERGR